jgi:hypothetical protein
MMMVLELCSVQIRVSSNTSSYLNMINDYKQKVTQELRALDPDLQ